MKITEKHVLFWGGILSNWATIPNGITYIEQETGEILKFSCSEQLFMYLKAKYFNDFDVADKIAKEPDPKKVKMLGRQVKGFDEKEWEEVRESKMFIAVSYKAKFYPLFRDTLLAHKDKHFVEASPMDKIWGIGLEENDPAADNESCWKGLNLLGKTLDKVRDSIVK